MFNLAGLGVWSGSSFLVAVRHLWSEVPGPGRLPRAKGAFFTYSILIVDDNPVVRRTLRACFRQRADWQVCGEAADGQEALEKAQLLKPDLIILDLSMPVMNGLDAARKLKLLNPSIRMLMFTSFKSSNLEKEAMAAGCTAVIEKSDLELLFSSVYRLLASAA